MVRVPSAALTSRDRQSRPAILRRDFLRTRSEILDKLSQKAHLDRTSLRFACLHARKNASRNTNNAHVDRLSPAGFVRFRQRSARATGRLTALTRNTATHACFTAENSEMVTCFAKRLWNTHEPLRYDSLSYVREKSRIKTRATRTSPPARVVGYRDTSCPYNSARSCRFGRV